jgi:hypothetical protein
MSHRLCLSPTVSSPLCLVVSSLHCVSPSAPLSLPISSFSLSLYVTLLAVLSTLSVLTSSSASYSQFSPFISRPLPPPLTLTLCVLPLASPNVSLPQSFLPISPSLHHAPSLSYLPPRLSGLGLPVSMSHHNCISLPIISQLSLLLFSSLSSPSTYYLIYFSSVSPRLSLLCFTALFLPF